MTKSAEKLNEEKTDLSKQIDKLAQDNNWCHTSRQELIQSHMDLNEQKLDLQRELGELDHLIKPLCHHMSNTSSLSTNELPSFDHGFMSLV